MSMTKVEGFNSAKLMSATKTAKELNDGVDAKQGVIVALEKELEPMTDAAVRQVQNAKIDAAKDELNVLVMAVGLQQSLTTVAEDAWDAAASKLKVKGYKIKERADGAPLSVSLSNNCNKSFFTRLF